MIITLILPSPPASPLPPTNKMAPRRYLVNQIKTCESLEVHFSPPHTKLLVPIGSQSKYRTSLPHFALTITLTIAKLTANIFLSLNSELISIQTRLAVRINQSKMFGFLNK